LIDAVDRASLHREMDDARLEIRWLLSSAITEDLRRGTRGTRWTNGELFTTSSSGT